MDILYFIVVLLSASVISTLLCQRLGLGSVLGYLLAGLWVGPHGLAMVDDVHRIFHLSELGVVLLLFFIGLELQPSRLWAMAGMIGGGGISQLLLTFPLLCLAFAFASNWSWSVCCFAAGCASLSSTAFALQLLEELGELQTPHGRLGFAMLLLQDLAAIPALALLPYLAAQPSQEPFHWTYCMLVGLLLTSTMVLGPRWLSALFHLIAEQKNQELLTAATLGIVACAAFAMAQLGLSQALGAFLVGMLLAESKFRHELEANIQSFKGLLLGLFFMAVGMSMNVPLLLQDWPQLLCLTVLLIACKCLVLMAVGRSFKLTLPQQLTLALALCQGGEFAFVLLGLAAKLAWIEGPQVDQIVGIITLSMLLNALLFAWGIRWLRPKLEPTQAEPSHPPLPEQPNPVLIAGFGRVGQIVGRLLYAKGIPFTALDVSSSHIAFVESFGSKVFFGDASRLDILKAAGAEQARCIVLCIDEIAASTRTAEQIRRHFPKVPILARARNRAHAYQLMALGIPTVIRETLASSLEMAEQTLQILGASPQEAKRASLRFRQHDEALMQRSVQHQHDLPTLIAIGQQGRAELALLFAQDGQQPLDMS